LLVFVFLVLIFDLLVGAILKHYYLKQLTGQSHSLTYSLNECKSDIVIFGASTAQHHYIAQLIEDSLKLTCYNAGLDGGHSILLQYAQIKLLTKRYSPKYIILDLRLERFASTQKDYEKLSILLPYYLEFKEIRPLVLLRSRFEFLKLFSKIYPYNSNIINILRFNTYNYAARKKDIKGYIPLFGEINTSQNYTNGIEEYNDLPDTNFINSLKSIIDICSNKGIKLILVSSPVFNTTPDTIANKTQAAITALSIIRESNVFYKDYTNDINFINHPELFKDKGHLNNTGADIFTNLIIMDLINKN
jgi:hypothetical protein